MKNRFRSVTFAAVLALAHVSVAQAQANELQKLIEGFGFEYRPKQEIPWGVQQGPAEDLVWTEIKGTRYLTSRRPGFSQFQLHDVMLGYLERHGRKEVELISLLLLRSPFKYEASFAEVFPSEQLISIVKPPAHQYSAQLPGAVIAGKEYMVFCNFLFVEMDGLYKMVLAKRSEYQDYDSISEPRCDLK